jgi:hypothetical protein
MGKKDALKKIMLTAEQNDRVLKLLEYVINKTFEKEVVTKLADYMGGELMYKIPTSENEYQKKIENPMSTIFDEVKHNLERKLKIKIKNKIYEPPIKNQLHLAIGIYGLNGNFYFNSGVGDRDGPIANTFENSPFRKNIISGIKSSDNYHVPFYGNTIASNMKVAMSEEPNIVGTSRAFFPLVFESVGYRACRKLINPYTGNVGGILVIVLYNVSKSTIANLLTDKKFNSNVETIESKK